MDPSLLEGDASENFDDDEKYSRSFGEASEKEEDSTILHIQDYNDTDPRIPSYRESLEESKAEVYFRSPSPASSSSSSSSLPAPANLLSPNSSRHRPSGVTFQLPEISDSTSNALIHHDPQYVEIHDALAERDHLTRQNLELQRKVLALKEKDKKRKGEEKSDKDAAASSSDNYRSAYLLLIQETSRQRELLRQKEAQADLDLGKLQSKKGDKEAVAAELRESFKNFKRVIARSAISVRTGKPIPKRILFEVEDEEEKLDAMIAAVRTDNIFLRNEYRKLEKQVGEKDHLGETGLGIIEFEQFRIENQNLNEKIEERNDELHKLRKKTTQTVQVLTHIKEKLHCVRQENSVLAAQVAEQDVKLTALRDALTQAKQTRESLRTENFNLKQKQGFISSDLLVLDFEGRKGTLEEMQAYLQQLQARHRELTEIIRQGAAVEQSLGGGTGNFGNSMAGGVGPGGSRGGMMNTGLNSSTPMMMHQNMNRRGMGGGRAGGGGGWRMESSQKEERRPSAGRTMSVSPSPSPNGAAPAADRRAGSASKGRSVFSRTGASVTTGRPSSSNT
eukprot:TRINITY_DN3237_c0_g1_i2.p1 TRINITY_DN3237_c0_g1~~TRINITY_DN3237_c0_g1_i2.p1  ORF type:complete len:562 (-),score=72.83 TRINITY_DN3237_c0_g1_i2:45-1730(-)